MVFFSFWVGVGVGVGVEKEKKNFLGCEKKKGTHPPQPQEKIIILFC